MIRIDASTRPELTGAKGIAFKAHVKVTMDNHLTFSSPAEYNAQLARVKAIESMGHALVPFPCECDFNVGANNGHQIFSGTVKAYDQRALEAGRGLIAQLNQLCYDFSVKYPQSQFKVKCVQAFEVTKIYR